MGDSAFLLPNQNEASPAALLVESRTQQKSSLFLLPARRSLGAGGEEKIGQFSKSQILVDLVSQSWNHLQLWVFEASGAILGEEQDESSFVYTRPSPA